MNGSELRPRKVELTRTRIQKIKKRDYCEDIAIHITTRVGFVLTKTSCMAMIFTS